MSSVLATHHMTLLFEMLGVLHGQFCIDLERIIA